VAGQRQHFLGVADAGAQALDGLVELEQLAQYFI